MVAVTGQTRDTTDAAAKPGRELGGGDARRGPDPLVSPVHVKLSDGSVNAVSHSKYVIMIIYNAYAKRMEVKFVSCARTMSQKVHMKCTYHKIISSKCFELIMRTKYAPQSALSAVSWVVDEIFTYR
ncbi:hypothetical protein EVAR_83906_1 [Eumeta japonica]|uniref:Uncharacterized protein n=1 Tax=Eumeta variegata TaxID=151549 RepID=A0A4C1USP0_EUMVA|nr:hypothetical protein EVAR_83906_1 [Eumeta japonica]